MLMTAALRGIAMESLRSVVPDLVQLLHVFLNKCVEESRVWVREILFDVRSHHAYLKLIFNLCCH
jgi:hypothetical protein